jgi:hypothetical protein
MVARRIHTLPSHEEGESIKQGIYFSWILSMGEKQKGEYIYNEKQNCDRTSKTAICPTVN